MKDFVYSYPTVTWFGAGAAARALRTVLPRYGTKVMLAYGGGSIKKNGIYDEITSLLREDGKTIVEFSGIKSNPTLTKVREGAELARREKVDLILAVGGGSTSDCCKVVSAQAMTDEDIWAMQFDRHVKPTRFIPLGIIVTVAGTGSDQNNIAVITNEERRFKAGITGAAPDFSILDPAYTLSVPMPQVVSGAFDTLSHCMESYFGKPQDDNLTDELTEGLMRHVIRYTRALVADPKDVNVRGELMWAASMAENGMPKIGKITDFQGHEIAQQFAVRTDCNHGQSLAVVQPILYRHLYRAAPARFARWARVVWGVNATDDLEAAKAGVEALEKFIIEVGLPNSFRKMGFTDRSFYRDVANSCRIKPGCCRQLTPGEIYDILTECY